MSVMLLTIGAVARAADCAPSRIRFYERSGVLPPALRVNGQRRYPPAAVATLRLIATLQSSGLSLDEIGVVLGSADEPDGRTRLEELGARKLDQLRHQLADVAASIAVIEHSMGCSCPPGPDDDAGPDSACVADMERRREAALTRAREELSAT